MIAATALPAEASIATRDARGVVGCGLTVTDPWTTRETEDGEYVAQQSRMRASADASHANAISP
jgi:hypothetical protein